jgi:type I restriction enzyme S subunit
MNQQPSCWELVKLYDLVSFAKTGLVRSADQQGSDKPFPYLKMNNINQEGKFNYSPISFIDASAEEVESSKLENGDFIFNTRNSSDLVGKCGIYQTPARLSNTPVLYNNNLLRIKFNIIDPRIVSYWLLSPQGKALLNEVKSATTSVAAIYQRDLMQINVPLPPLAEQTRIAQKLDELLAQVDTLKARIDAIPALLKRFRQSVLAAAISGRLTEEWQKENEAPKPQERKIGDLFKLIDGDRGPNYPKKEDYQASGYCLFLSTKNVRKYGFEFHEKSFLSKQKHETLRSGTLSRGDIVITTRGTLGNVASYDSSIPYEVVRINSGMLILRKTDSNFENDFFKILIASPSFQKLIDDQRSGSAQPQLPAKVIREFLVRVPSTKEQTEIVRRVEQLFAFADQLEAKVASAKSRIDHLTQSILAKAFRGELVPQDPNDEPASVLLERIQAQRTAAPKAKRGRKSA